MRRLNSAAEVVEALGGDEKVAVLCGSNSKAVWNWTGYFDAFPANSYALMMRELRRRECTAPAYLWKMRGFERPKRAA